MNALVAGAEGGIGRCVADELRALGYAVLAADVSGGHPLDVTCEDSWARAVDACRPLDLLVNCAGVLVPSHVADLSARAVQAQLDVNVRGVILGTRAAAGAMGRGGHIVNLASLAGLTPVPGLSVYSASKAAVRSFSIAAAAELAPRGIAVTVVCPDAVQTPMLELQRDRPEAALTFSGTRVLTPEEVARAIVGPVLRRRPLEYWLPAWRGWLCRVSDLFPDLALRALPHLRRRGLDRQGR